MPQNRQDYLGLAGGGQQAVARPGAAADGYDEVWRETHYITQCSFSTANGSVRAGRDKPGYGVINSWRIGNGHADFVQPGEAAIGAIGLLYGYRRLSGAGRDGGDLSWRAREALSSFFWSWLRNPGNRSGAGYPVNISYNANGDVTSKGGGDARVTAELLMAMRKYVLLSPNGDGETYQRQEIQSG